MRLIDLRCATCQRVQLDHLERDEDKSRPDCCGQSMERVFLPTNRGTVIGDEIDITVKNGLCHADGTPRRFRSRTELQKAEQAAGQMNYVVHRGTKDGDKSPHTSKWI